MLCTPQYGGHRPPYIMHRETVIRDASQVDRGAAVRVRVARGRMDCEVKEVSSGQ
ncbi:MAG: hypothetical protein ACLQED_11115 [Desulfobaccales bacterium]